MPNKSKSENISNVDFETSKQQYEYGRASVINEVKEMELKLDSAKWVYEMAGKIKATRFAHHQSEFLTLLMLKQVKETKEYRLKYGMTWVDFCEYVGLKQRNVDLQLEDLEPFRVDFLATFADFMGADISKIKYLGKAISAKIADFDGESIIVGDEKIPCIPERAGDINALFDRLKEDLHATKEEFAAQKKAFDRVQADTHKTVTRLEKELNRFKKIAEGRELKPEEEAFQKQMGLVRSGFDGYMLSVDPEHIRDVQEEEDVKPTPRMIADYLSTLDYMRKQILAAFDTAMDIFGNATIAPEEFDWTPPTTKTE